MNLPYIVNAALILVVCLSFYKILLRRETFYKVNRYLLIICLAISFTLPLIHVPQAFSLRKPTESTAVAKPHFPTVKDETVTPSKPIASPPSVQSSPIVPAHNEFTFSKLMNWVIALYWFGVIVFGASFLFQVVVLIYRAYRNPVIIDGQFRIVEVRGEKAPCSFGNNIFINPEKYDWDTYNQILLHEKIHVRQKHTLDIILSEAVLIFQWFNPFAWIYRREIESNLEFLTDDELMQQKKIDKKTYQLSLVKVSAPHFPLSLTTNYNQSILKKRIAMMNAKRSNLHTAWKYCFLIPVLAFVACLLNEPAAISQTNSNKDKPARNHDIETEGSWFATIKGDKISIQFTRDDDENNDHGFSGNTYNLSELSPSPKEGPATFKLTRDAGTIEFTGRFESNTGMGHYKFVADKAYGGALETELKDKLEDRDLLVFFFVNLKKGFVSMLKSEGFPDVDKENLIALAAMDIDQPYIHNLKNTGIKDLSLENLITFKALGIDEKYIGEIRGAGYKNISTDQLVSFKAQGIDKEYISKMKKSKSNDGKADEDDAEELVSFKAMDITDDFINSFKPVGLTHLQNEEWVSLKATGVTPAYIKSWQDQGFKDLSVEDYIGLKSQDVTPAYLKSFADMGYKNVKAENLVAFKALQITPEWIKSFESIGYKNIDMEQLPALKSQDITPEFIKGFEAIGFKDIDIEEIVSVKAMGVTPEYIKEMRAKGFNYDSLQKYVTLKSID